MLQLGSAARPHAHNLVAAVAAAFASALHRCGEHGHGCLVDAYGDHHAACPCTGLLARRAKPLEHAWVRVARETVGPEGQVVPQQWLARTLAPDVDPADRCASTS